MRGKMSNGLGRGAAFLAWLWLAGSPGCAAEAASSVGAEQAAMGTEFGRVWLKAGAELYTLQMDDAHPTGHLIPSRAVQKGGFVALLGYTDAAVTDGACTRFEHGLAAIELATTEPSPTFFVDKRGLVGAEDVVHDPAGIGIRTESILSTETLDTCGTVLPSPTQITQAALLRPVRDDMGRILPVYLDVTAVTPLRIVPETNDIAGLDMCIPDRFWDSALGSGLADILAGGLFRVAPHNADEECSSEGQGGHFVRITRDVARRLHGSPEYVNFQRLALGVGTLASAAEVHVSRVVLAVAGLLVAAVGAGIVWWPRLNLPAPELSAHAFIQGTSTVADAAMTAYEYQTSSEAYNRYTCVAVCGDSFLFPPSPSDTIRTGDVSSLESLRRHLSESFPQGEQALYAFGSANMLEPAKVAATANLQKAYSAVTNTTCENPVVPICIFTTY